MNLVDEIECVEHDGTIENVKTIIYKLPNSRQKIQGRTIARARIQNLQDFVHPPAAVLLKNK